MDQTEQRKIDTRLGQFILEEDKSIHFPRGLIGMERFKEFALLQIKPDSPFLLLQSLDDSRLGLLVADPFSFIREFEVRLSSVEENVLQVEDKKDLAIMVTVSIPSGNPESATLNLSGPIVINSKKKLGLQSVQAEPGTRSRVLLSELRSVPDHSDITHL